MNDKLVELSKSLNVTYKAPTKKASSHKTGSDKKMIELFKGRKDLLDRVLKIFEQDCLILPQLCNVTQLLEDI